MNPALNVQKGPASIPPRDEALVRRVLDGMVERGETPGVQYLFAGVDEVLFEHHAGLADVAQRQPVDAHTTFNAYSVTKTLTAAAILQLAEQGRVELDRPIAHYLDRSPYPPGPTVRQTLLHRGGFPNPNPMRWTHLDEEHARFDPTALVRDVTARHLRLKAAPGQSTAYSNIGYLLLGQVVEKVSGLPYTDHVERHLIAPLALAEGAVLGFDIADPQAHARGHLARWSVLNGVLGLLLDRGRLVEGTCGDWVRFRNHHVNGAAYRGADRQRAGTGALPAGAARPGRCLFTGIARSAAHAGA